MPTGELFTVILRASSCLLPLIILLLTVIPVFTGESFVISERTLQRAEERYGPGARSRMLDWQHLIETEGGNTLEKLEKVNSFFNKIPFNADILHWQKDDYWATPAEFLASNGGDCEDFTIAKYFTLMRLGVAENQLTLTYVKALRLNQAHMVLTYYPAPGKEPLVLDNLIDTIEPSSKRTDLLPIYSFNGSSLWLAKQRGKGKILGDSSRLSRWQNLLDRMTEEFHTEEENP